MYRYLAALLIAVPAFADQKLFERISAADSVRIVLPAGYCDTTVIGRAHDRLSLALKRTSTACGEKGNIVEVMRSDAYDVAFRQRRRLQSPAARMAVKSAAVVVVVNSIAMSIPTGGRARSLARVAGAVAVTSALSTRKQGYVVAAERITQQP
jgi:hypothetical protein